MRESFYFINSVFTYCLHTSKQYVYFDSDDSPPEEMAPPWKTGTLDTYL